MIPLVDHRLSMWVEHTTPCCPTNQSVEYLSLAPDAHTLRSGPEGLVEHAGAAFAALVAAGGFDAVAEAAPLELQLRDLPEEGEP